MQSMTDKYIYCSVQLPSTILKVKKMERMKSKHKKITGVRKKASDSRKTKQRRSDIRRLQDKQEDKRERKRVREKREWERGKDKTQAVLSKAGTAERTRHLYCAPQRQGHCEKSAAQHRLTQRTAVPVLHPQKNHTAMPCSSCCSAMTLLLNCTAPQTNPAKDNKRELTGLR